MSGLWIKKQHRRHYRTGLGLNRQVAQASGNESDNTGLVGSCYMNPHNTVTVAGSVGTDDSFTNNKFTFAVMTQTLDEGGVSDVVRTLYPPYVGGRQVECLIDGVLQIEGVDYDTYFNYGFDGQASPKKNYYMPTSAGSYVRFRKNVDDAAAVTFKTFA